jgi:hypothetical protein
MQMGFLAFLAAGFGTVTLSGGANSPGADPSRSRERKALCYQQEVDGYAGVIDTEIWEVSPNEIMEKNDRMSSDADNGGGESQILVRFEGIIGTGPNQVPPKATIHSAKLLVTAFDPGNTVNMCRMLVPWDRAATWNSMIAGVTADGMEASRHADSFTFGRITNSKSVVVFDSTDTVQAWVNGAPNHGWVFINTGSNGWDFYSSEYAEVASRPKLVIEFSVNDH